MKSAKTIRLASVLLWSIFSLFLVSTNALAQTAKVSGTITNQRTSAPVPGATINVRNSTRYSVSDDGGKFSIEASASDVLVITSIGYLPEEVNVGAGNLTIHLNESNSQ